MKSIYETPTMEIDKFKFADIINTSGGWSEATDSTEDYWDPPQIG